ncbi:MAG: DUF58 domain-containing protein [Phycisphaerales bacterium]
MLKLSTPSRPRTIDELLDAQLVARLSAVDITSKKILAGKLKGERRSKRRGQSVEFADHRPYVVGDDLRHIDWNIMGRLEKLFLKMFLEEEDLALNIVLDASGSHDAGEPSKFVFMQRLAIALGYIGLTNMHRVTVSAIGGELLTAAPVASGGPAVAAGSESTDGPRVLSQVRDLRGRRRLSDLGRWLCSLEPVGEAPFTEGCKRLALSRRGKGVTIVISDFLIKEGYETGLRLMLGRGYDVYAIQVLSPQEIEPKLGGDLRLRDCEDGDMAEVTISAPLLKRYKATLTAYCNRLRDFCAARGIMHMTVPSDTKVDALVLDVLRRKGLVK